MTPTTLRVRRMSDKRPHHLERTPVKKLDYFVGGQPFRAHDAAILLNGDDPRETLAESVIQTISTDVEVTLGTVKIHLAAIIDPDHWEEDWRERGIEDVDGFLTGLVTDNGR